MANNRRKEVLQNMEQRRQQQSRTDIEIKCKDGVVYAHELVLTSSCAYFESMFNAAMQEKKTGQVNFCTESKNVIETIVKYLYTSQIPEIPIDSDFERDLIRMSDMMGLDKLIDRFLKHKTKQLNPENFADFWATVTDFGYQEREPVQRFLKNSLKIVCDEKSVQKLSDDQMTKLLECIDHDECCRIQVIFGWKSGGDGREKRAAEEIRKIDLHYLSDSSLYRMLMDVVSSKEETAENILIREGVERMNRHRKPEIPFQSQVVYPMNIPLGMEDFYYLIP